MTEYIPYQLRPDLEDKTTELLEIEEKETKDFILQLEKILTDLDTSIQKLEVQKGLSTAQRMRNVLELRAIQIELKKRKNK